MTSLTRRSYALLSRADVTPAGAVATLVNSSVNENYLPGGFSETTIWSRDSTNTLTAVWINPDGTPSTVTVLGLPSASYIYISGDPATCACRMPGFSDDAAASRLPTAPSTR